MSESKELVLASLPVAPADLEAAFINDDYISNLIADIRGKASSVVGDVTTVKGRGVYISMASNVRKTKTAIDDAGKALVAEMKKRPAMVDASRRRVREALDELAVEVRRPATEWEEEQARIKAEEEAKLAAAELAMRIEEDHEKALLMNEIFDRDLAESRAEAERQRIAHEEELKRQAEEKVKRELEEKAQRERDEAARRETELKLKAEQAERDRVAAEQKAIADKKEAQEKAEREKQQAIEAERRKAAEAEQARLAEEKRIADEAAKRTADVEHKREVNRAAFDGLVNAGIPEEWARECVKAIALGKVPNVMISY